MIELRVDMLEKKKKSPSWWYGYSKAFGEWKTTLAPKTSQDFIAEFSAHEGIRFTCEAYSDMNQKTGKATYWETVFTFPTEEDKTAFLLKYS